MGVSLQPLPNLLTMQCCDATLVSDVSAVDHDTVRTLFIVQVNDTHRIMLNNAQDVKTSNYEKIATIWRGEQEEVYIFNCL